MNVCEFLDKQPHRKVIHSLKLSWLSQQAYQKRDLAKPLEEVKTLNAELEKVKTELEIARKEVTQTKKDAKTTTKSANSSSDDCVVFYS